MREPELHSRLVRNRPDQPTPEEDTQHLEALSRRRIRLFRKRKRHRLPEREQFAGGQLSVEPPGREHPGYVLAEPRRNPVRTLFPLTPDVVEFLSGRSVVLPARLGQPRARPSRPSQGVLYLARVLIFVREAHHERGEPGRDNAQLPVGVLNPRRQVPLALAFRADRGSRDLIRFPRHSSAVDSGMVERQETQIVQSWLTLDDFLP